MVFNTGAALLDAIVLAVVSNENEGTYGYKITQDVRQVLEVSESTLYPVLRRLLKDQCLETYDREYGGRNRRYYKITEKGTVQLNLYRTEWKSYSTKISTLFEGGIQTGTERNFWRSLRGFYGIYRKQTERTLWNITKIILRTQEWKMSPL